MYIPLVLFFWRTLKNIEMESGIHCARVQGQEKRRKPSFKSQHPLLLEWKNPPLWKCSLLHIEFEDLVLTILLHSNRVSLPGKEILQGI
jgi:hypothetical protein